MHGLNNEIIQTIVLSKGETAVINLHKRRPGTEMLSAREGEFSVHKGYRNIFEGPSRVSVQANDGASSSKVQVLRGPVEDLGS